MIEELWFVAILWVFLLVLGIKTRNPFFSGLSAVFSFFFGFMLISNLPSLLWFGMLIFITGLYLLYETLYRNMRGRR